LTASHDIGVVILAAGSSSRLGQPKQLLEFRNKTMLQHVIDNISVKHFDPRVLVLGAHADRIREATDLKDVTVLENEHWSEGIASSIRLGVVKSMQLNESLDSILFLLCDQPFVTTELIEELIQKHTHGEQRITACRYEGSTGVPALFRSDFFPQLTELTGDLGAKKIIARNRDRVESVDFKRGSFDVDTREDYNKLRDKQK